MSDATQGLIAGAIFTLLSVIVPVVVNYFLNKRKTQSEVGQIDANTIQTLSKQVNELIKDKSEMLKVQDNLEIRIENLERELKRTTNAYARAIKFINDNIPGTIIPDFMETNPKITK